MHLSLSHHLFSISTPSNHKSTTKTPISCNILLDPSKKTLPTPPPLLPPPAFSPESVPPPLLSPVQKLAAAALDAVENSILIKLEKNRKLNPMIDPAVQLEGNYAPVQELPVQHGLEVVGTIPSSVQGVYLRNGGNTLFPPTAGHHFFDGDGMIHAVTLAGGKTASYACRFTKTNRLLAEASLGKPFFPKPIGELQGRLGVARLALFYTRAAVGLADLAQGVGMANVALTYFNGRLLALSEDDLPYVVRIRPDGDLETIGRYDFDGQLGNSMIAHPKVDPATGNLYSLSYNVLSKPHLKFFKFDTCGNMSREVEISLQQPTMIHDFAMTQSHVIIPDHQMVFKLSEMIRGGSPVVYDTNKVSRFGVMSKNATHESMIQWIDVPDCFCFHMWNAWEEVDDRGHEIVVVINSCLTPVDSLYFSGGDEPLRAELSEIRLNLDTGRSTRKVIVSGINLEGGQVDKRQLGKRTRYVYLAIAEPWPKCSGIAKVDLSTGNVVEYLYGGRKFGGEVCFVPKNAEEDEDEDEEEGFLMSFVRDEERETSEFVILKGSNMKQVASIKIPSRVPYGFHGTFVSAQELAKQSLF
ncbi:9-cis-epoxycarotenoid dioxygenase NCED6, chloroplastic-like [Salvia miltiorrhiza]|uniref:9-cis-epoxycarotenoid dioxygenase NCED6, chloroplastic-like n=1 Tax=Salvia miltiorrhiza TaxID=226208 RepID=UPI0025AB6762|nr:9-cis-epoxycarotenoid dioxygenase NCED6, chloroplastic-like [Salvia miltiorrhiza]